MVRSGVPILQALRALQRQTVRGTMHDVLQEMAFGIEAGESLSTTMSRHPDVFDPFILGVVRTGEASGKLSEALESIAGHLEQDYVFRRKVQAALTYPVLVLMLVILLGFIMFTYVLPQLIELFDDAGVKLPWATRLLIVITRFLQNFWYLLIVFVVAVVMLIRSYMKTAEGRYTMSSLILHVPIVNRLFQKIYLSRMSSILHTLFSSDVPILESLSLAKEAVGNRVYKRILDDTAKAVKDGAPISFVWKQEPYMPSMLTSMVEVGERSGEISESFAEASRFFKRDVNQMLDTIAVLLEPVLIVILGIGVGFVVGAVLLPIYNLVLVL